MALAASISNLSSPSPTFLSSKNLPNPRSPSSFSPPPNFLLLSTPLSLSLRNNLPLASSLLVRCSQVDPNGSHIKRTTLHDLYEKEGQSPWCDNLCCPVTDLIPLIESGVRGVTSNPAIFQKAISTSNAYNEQFSDCSPSIDSYDYGD